MRKVYLILIVFLAVSKLYSQGKYLTKEGYISFFSHSIVEDIKADNRQVLSVIDTETGEIAVQLLMRSFLFKKALMQQHFNESYVESHKYPKATFKGNISNYEELNNQNGETEIKGILTVHGKEKEISVIAKFEFAKGQINISGDFMVEVADFDIKIPSVVRNNIAKVIKVTFDLKHIPYKK
jgi:polyisoprenoid-binding protein YceI